MIFLYFHQLHLIFIRFQLRIQSYEQQVFWLLDFTGERGVVGVPSLNFNLKRIKYTNKQIQKRI